MHGNVPWKFECTTTFSLNVAKGKIGNAPIWKSCENLTNPKVVSESGLFCSCSVVLLLETVPCLFFEGITAWIASFWMNTETNTCSKNVLNSSQALHREKKIFFILSSGSVWWDFRLLSVVAKTERESAFEYINLFVDGYAVENQSEKTVGRKQLENNQKTVGNSRNFLWNEYGISFINRGL